MKSEWSQVNRQDDPNVIRVSALRPAIGYIAARSLRYRSRIFDDCLGWGEQRDYVPRQALRHLPAWQAAFAAAFLLLAGFVARSLSTAAQTSTDPCGRVSSAASRGRRVSTRASASATFIES